MKKLRSGGIALLSAFLCLFLIAAPAFPAAAAVDASSAVFTVANDQMLDLSDDTLPIAREGQVYLPYTVFSDNFYIRSSYNRVNNYLILQNDEKALIFDITRGLAYNKSMETVYVKALSESGRVYVPASYVASYFGLTYSWISDGPIVRIKNSVAAYPDSFLPSLYRTKMQSMLDALSSGGPKTEPATTPGQPTSPEQEIPTRTLYLTFDDGPNAASDAIMDVLGDYGYKATFFLIGSEITENEDVVRRMAVEGHGIGLHSYSHDRAQFYASTQAMLDELAHENDLLKKILKTKTRLVRVPFGSGEAGFTQEFRDALQDAGYRYWDWNASCSDSAEGATVHSVTQAAIRALEQGDDNPVVLLMHSTELTAKALPSILSYIEQNHFTVRVIRETDTPVNDHNDIF